MSKFTLYGLVIQCLACELLFATEGKAQMESIYELRVALSESQLHLKGFIREIEAQTQLNFTFDDARVDLKAEMELQTTEGILADILREVSRGYHLKFQRINENVHVSKSSSNNQPVSEFLSNRPPTTITGQVTSDDAADGLPGVNVIVKGSTTGTVTDVNGKYAINVPSADAILVFTSVGYEPEEIKVGNQSVINLIMSPNIQELQELVVIGYGQRSKRDVTSAISQVDSDDISKRVAMSPEMAMQGQMSGVQVVGNNGDPNARPTIRIRGTNTWGVADPLYVIDGVPIEEYGAGVEGDSYVRGTVNIMSMINPDDIESISVLKDASAGAIYGVRASNGVVLITTKKGRDKKPSINYSQRIGVSNMVEKIDLLNTQEYTNHVNALYASDPTSEDSRHPLNDVFRPDDPSYLGDSPTYDWQDAVLNKNALTQDYNVSISGGSSSSDYYVSAGYSNHEGIFIGSDMERLSGSIKLNTDINKYIRAGVNYRISSVKSHNPPIESLAKISLTPPWQPIHDPNGLNGYAHVIKGFDENGVWDNQVLYGQATRNNVPGFMSMNDNYSYSLRHIGSAYLEVEPINGLTIKGSASMDNFNNGQDVFYQYNRSYFQYDGPNPEVLGGPSSVGSYERRIVANKNMVYEVTANYQRSFGDHNLDVLFNSMLQQYSADWSHVGTEYVTSTNRDLVHFGGDRQFTRNSGFTTRGARAGLLLRTGYNYASKYYLDLTLRRDGSSKFASDYRWGYFPAVSAAWRISQEPFMSNVVWLNDLKLRAGWGELGNEEVPAYAFLSLINTAPRYAWGNNPENIGYGYGNSAATVYGLPNPELLWERTATLNIGFDSRLFDALDFSFEYYDKVTEGLLQQITIPPSSGIIDFPQDNIGDVRNRGIELNLNYQGNIGRFNYSVGGNFTTVHNEVLKTYKGIPLDNIEEGYSLRYIRGYKVDGIFQTDAEAQEWMANHQDDNYEEPKVTAGDMYFEDLRGAPTEEDLDKGINEFYSPEPDGVIDNYDRVFLGKTIPGYYYGINISGELSGFDLSMQFTGVGDVQKVNNIKTSLGNPYNIGLNRTRDVLETWTPENPNTEVPRLMFGDPAANMRFSDYFVENGDYLRLTNLQVGYTLPQSAYDFTNNIINNFRIYAGASNLFTLTKYKGLDPEDDSNPAPLIIYTGLNLRF